MLLSRNFDAGVQILFMAMRSLGWVLKLIFSGLIALPFFWVNQTLDISPIWNYALILAVSFSVLDRNFWGNFPIVSQLVWRIIIFDILAFITLLTTFSTTKDNLILAGFYVGTLYLLLLVSFAYEQPQVVLKLGVATFSVVISLIFAEIIAGSLLEEMRRQDAEKFTPPTQAAAVQESVVINTPSSTSEPETVTLEPTNTPENPTSTPTISSEPTATPEPERLIAGFGYVNVIEGNGQAEWSRFTGTAPYVNSTVHAYMYDVEGNVVYDNLINFNAKGTRGSEPQYEKPENVYRILIIGDSFVEALQVADDQTFYALLQDELDASITTQNQFEVIAVGRTGWSPLQEAIFYEVEGYKYNADLVIQLFYINDVADSYPTVFYPDINNTNYDYIFENDTIRLVDTNLESLPPNNPRILYNALPEILRETNLAQYYIRKTDPPEPVLTPGGVLTRTHPQFYIYVTDPEPEGYAEAWERVEQGLTILANQVEDDGGKLVVMPIFLGAEMVQNVSNWFPELVEGWQWDDGLPERRLSEILADTSADLVPTRPIFEAYADVVGGEVYQLIYIPEDGHFNALGHKLTKDTILNYLITNGIIGNN